MTMRIEINTTHQRLNLFETDATGTEVLQHTFPVSTAALGAGEQNGSFQTPRGRHLVVEKIGACAPLYTIFRARQATGEVWTPELGLKYPGQDWILSRILWLSGCEAGKNQGGSVDTQARYIYIHGTAAEHLLGNAVSHGCIRMSNADIIQLFEQVSVGTSVDIIEEGVADKL